ncbi:GDYXXLXY domain-containing protein [Candidatus Marithioploca araucensis]|uniref:GDYXXLXY domain-containing protein n=1 Tax=Candidatus Marithioploca araucensis TaxID=70273 RepID=A0ABT7VS68_9GAMM|nr:GDYXXLXY domain-containing protein [Candidatus Marithioploca araucensis]
MLRRLLVFVMAVVVLVVVNFEIYKKEQLLAEGITVFLELMPRDPRSIMQGDYMVLRYNIARNPDLEKVEKDGYIVIKRDEKQVAHFLMIYEGRIPLRANETLLRFRKRGGSIRLGAESFLFQEGHAKYYENARYGELRVTPSGESVLVGLRDEAFNLLGPPVDKVSTD